MFKSFKSAWMGEAPLYKVFWVIYFFYGSIVVLLADLFVDYFISGVFTPLYIHNQNTDEVITLSFPYFFFSSMCVFASSRHSKWWWRYAARFLVILVLIAASFHLTSVRFH